MFKSGSTSAPPPGFVDKRQFDVAEMERIMRERILYLTEAFNGSKVEVQKKDGTTYVGLLYACRTNKRGYLDMVLKSAKRKDAVESDDSFPILIISGKDIIQVYAVSVNLDREQGLIGGIMTDNEITGNGPSKLFGRKLEAADSWLDSSVELGLADDGPHKVGDWDQFEANKKLFGVDSTYNEEIYTTKLDKSKLSSKHAKAAERLAREIESSSSKNFHMAEERGQKHQSDDLDEESRYSSVIRAEGSYVPPPARNRSSSQAQKIVDDTSTDNISKEKPIKPAAWSSAKKSKEIIGGLVAKEPVTQGKNTPNVEAEKNGLERPKVDVALTPQNIKVDSKLQGSTQLMLAASPRKQGNPSNEKSSSETKKGASSEKETKEVPASVTKKSLNPNAKEFKLNVAAATFTPKYTVDPPVVEPSMYGFPSHGMPGAPVLYPAMPSHHYGYAMDEWGGHYDPNMVMAANMGMYAYGMPNPSMQMNMMPVVHTGGMAYSNVAAGQALAPQDYQGRGKGGGYEGATAGYHSRPASGQHSGGAGHVQPPLPQ